MNMTYRRLKDRLDEMTEEQLDCDVSIYEPSIGEFFPLGIHVLITPSDDNEDDDDPSIGILDEGHPYLTIDNLV